MTWEMLASALELMERNVSVERGGRGRGRGERQNRTNKNLKSPFEIKNLTPNTILKY